MIQWKEVGGRGVRWRKKKRSEQSNPKSEARLGEDYVDRRSTHARTHTSSCSHIHLHTYKHTQLCIGKPGSIRCLTGGSVSPEQQVCVAMVMMVVVVSVPEYVLFLLPWSLLLQPLLISREERPTLLMTPIDTDTAISSRRRKKQALKWDHYYFQNVLCLPLDPLAHRTLPMESQWTRVWGVL